jgi:ATP-binding cassette subfamily B protein RaxB
MQGGFSILSAVFALVVITNSSAWLTAVCVASIAASLLVDVSFLAPARSASDVALQASTGQRAFQLDLYGVIAPIRRMGVSTRARWSHRRVAQQASNGQLLELRIEGLRGAVNGAISLLDRLLFALIAGFMYAKGVIDLGAMVAVSVYREMLRSSISGAFDSYRRLRLLDGQRDMIAELMGPSSAVAEVVDIGQQTVGNCHGSLVVEGVSYRYGPFEAPVLNQLHLSVDEGQFVVISGESGSGKTTLARVIAGELPAAEGIVTLAGRDVRFSQAEISTVIASDRLISGTIAENIRLFRRNVTDVQVEDACLRSGLTPVIESLREGLNTHVSDTAATISTGQRQRILLARALCQPARLVVLDEVTSNLDEAMEQFILSRLKELRSTVILVSHRRSVRAWADKVYEMRCGRLFDETESLAKIQR